jgi:transcription elongation factor Elf1
MQELTCPCCGRVFKVVEGSDNTEKVVTIHCNKCNIDIKYSIDKNVIPNVISVDL